MTRLVLDASALLAGVVSAAGSPPAVLFSAAQRGALEPIACPQLLDEFARGLSKPYFAARVTPAERRRLVAGFSVAATVLGDPEDPPSVVRDPDDDYLIALAVSGRAEAIVTGDRDLLDAENLQPPAITPREACHRLGLSAPGGSGAAR